MSLKDRENFFDILLFIQAPADLPYALDIYKQNEQKKRILIYVINVKSVFEFVKSLKLKNIDIFFTEAVKYSIKKPLSIIKAKQKYKKIYQEITKISVSQVYFFSRIEDLTTCGLIGSLSRNKDIKIFYCKYNDDFGLIEILKNSLYYLKARLHNKIHYFITKEKFVCRYYGKSNEFAVWEYPIMEIDNSKKNIDIDVSYLYNKGLQAKSILFLLSPEDISCMSDKSIVDLILFLKNLKSKGLFLCLKGHPRLGTSKIIETYFDLILPNYVLSEFIDYQYIKAVIGLASTGLIYTTNTQINTQSYSIIKSIIMNNLHQKNLWIKYLNEMTNFRINYTSLNQLEQVLINE